MSKHRLAAICCALFLAIGLTIGFLLGSKASGNQAFETSEGLFGPRYLWKIERPKDGDSLTVRLVSVDGVDLSSLTVVYGVRLIGIDAPERGDCGFSEAKSELTELIGDSEFSLISGNTKSDIDTYGRLLRYVDIAGTDAGLELLKRKRVVAAYDSRYKDGKYGTHDREERYRALEPEKVIGC